MSFFEFPNTRTYDSDLGWLIKTMHDVIVNVNAQDEKIAAVEQLAADLKDFVNNYFDNLDVQQEINNKIDQMAQDGTLLAILNSPISDAVTQWLDNNIQPGTGVVDDTLSVSGAAADALVTGNRVEGLKAADILFNTTWTAGYIDDTGSIAASNNELTSDYIQLDPLVKLWFEITYTPQAKPWLRIAEYDKNQNFLRRGPNIFNAAVNIQRDFKSYITHNDCCYIRVSYTTNADNNIISTCDGYQDAVVLDDIIRQRAYILMSIIGWCYEPGNRRRIVIERSTDVENGLNIYIPDRVFIMGYGPDMLTYQASGNEYTRIQMPNNSFLYYDILSNQIRTASYSAYVADTRPKICLIYCSYARALGAWSIYQPNETDPVYSNIACIPVEWVSRQGSISIAPNLYTPENSLIGAAKAKQYGYNRVRISIQFTSDNVPVAFHDATIGSGIVYQNGEAVPSSDTRRISDMTLAQLQQYDFGAYANDIYAGTQIATLEDHIRQAKKYGYALDLELKENVTPITDAQFDIILNLLYKYGAAEVTGIGCYFRSSLQYFAAQSPYLILIYEVTAIDTARIDTIAALRTTYNKVYIFVGRTVFETMTDALFIYARQRGVLIQSGDNRTTQDLATMAEKLDKIECGYIQYPLNKLIAF